LRIFEVDRLVNDCPNDSHTMSMQLDTGWRAHQQVLQKMSAELPILFLGKLLAQISDLSRCRLRDDPIVPRGSIPPRRSEGRPLMLRWLSKMPRDKCPETNLWATAQSQRRRQVLSVS
jgi:hypothetical protein